MSKHDYIVLGMAALFIVTNFLGAAFTIRHVRSQRVRQSEGIRQTGRPAPAE
jgi:hypothetical protein